MASSTEPGIKSVATRVPKRKPERTVEQRVGSSLGHRDPAAHQPSPPKRPRNSQPNDHRRNSDSRWRGVDDSHGYNNNHHSNKARQLTYDERESQRRERERRPAGRGSFNDGKDYQWPQPRSPLARGHQGPPQSRWYIPPPPSSAVSWYSW